MTPAFRTTIRHHMQDAAKGTGYVSRDDRNRMTRAERWWDVGLKFAAVVIVLAIVSHVFGSWPWP